MSRAQVSAAASTARTSSAQAIKRAGDEQEFEGVRVTHPDRTLFGSQDVTKRALIEYYLSVAELMSTFPVLARWVVLVDLLLLLLRLAASAVRAVATPSAATIASTAARWRTARSADPRVTA